MASAGAFILMLNHSYNTGDEKFPTDSSLGYNWRCLIRNRLFLMRDEKDRQSHIALAKNKEGEMVI
jgi:hypothetical protein